MVASISAATLMFVQTQIINIENENITTKILIFTGAYFGAQSLRKPRSKD